MILLELSMHRVRTTLAALVICGATLPATAQDTTNAGHVPNSVPLSTERARSYSILNRSSHPIVAAHARMTNGDERDLTWDKPIRPRQGRNVAMPSRDCLAELTVRFQSGRTMQSGSPGCRQTRITVTDDAIRIGSSASDRPPVQ
jgi:hypothetical protein